MNKSYIYNYLLWAVLIFNAHYATAQTKTIKYLSKSGLKEVSPSEAHYFEVKVKNTLGGGTRTRFLAADSSQVNLYSYSDLEGGKYGAGILDGPHFAWHRNGKLKAQGNYSAGKLAGDYKEWFENGQLQYKKNYQEGVFQDSLLGYYETGNLRRVEVYRNGEMISGKVYDEAGKEVSFYPMMKMPEFPGGEKMLLSWLGNNVRYPFTTKSDGVQGVVVINFVVGKHGSIREAEVSKSIHPDADAEGLRVVNNMPAWQPGLQEGEPVDINFTLPIKFSFR